MQRPYTLPLKHTHWVQEELKIIEKAGIISQNVSPWLSSIVTSSSHLHNSVTFSFPNLCCTCRCRFLILYISILISIFKWLLTEYYKTIHYTHVYQVQNDMAL